MERKGRYVLSANIILKGLIGKEMAAQRGQKTLSPSGQTVLFFFLTKLLLILSSVKREEWSLVQLVIAIGRRRFQCGAALFSCELKSG